MDEDEKAPVIDEHERPGGLEAVDAAALEAFKRAMTDDVIPEIVRVVEDRRLLAAESRHWQLKC